MAKVKKTRRKKKCPLGPDFEGMMVADGFEKAVIGFSAYQPGRLPTVIYDYEECIAVLMNRDDMEYAEAVEYMEFNVTGAWFGEGTPIFMHRKSVR